MFPLLAVLYQCLETCGSYTCSQPKCHPVTCAGDFRPISVTSLLCQLTEKLVVKNYVQPTFKNLDRPITDQYAYKPTGSTTAALIDITHRTSLYLENHDYVRCVLIDFSKAFDTVNHSILIEQEVKVI